MYVRYWELPVHKVVCWLTVKRHGTDQSLLLTAYRLFASARLCRLLAQAIFRPWSRAKFSAGMRLAIRRAMTAMTTSSSISVKA